VVPFGRLLSSITWILHCRYLCSLDLDGSPDDIVHVAVTLLSRCSGALLRQDKIIIIISSSSSSSILVPSIVKIPKIKKEKDKTNNLEELEVRIVDSNETIMQQNCVVALQSNRQPLKKRLKTNRVCGPD